MKSYVVLLAAAVGGAACGSSEGGGATSTPTTDAGNDGSAGTAPLACTSGTQWTGGDRGSSRMHPGRACIACHSVMAGPTFSVAGTVYPSAHEPPDCNGINGTTTPTQVIITDKDGNELKLPVNSAGNFYLAAVPVAAPYAAKVMQGTKERAMVQHQTSGDCNSCHTETGADGAPGRIMAP